MFRAILSILSLITAMSFGAVFPEKSQVEEALSTIATYVSAPETVKAEKRDRLLTALRFAYSVTANQEFWNYLNQHWDASLSIEKKRELMAATEKQALEVAKKRVEALLQTRNENGKLLLTRVIYEAMPTNTATESYYERDKFIGENGKLDFRIAEFGLDTTIPIEKRVAADPILWADSHFTRNPEERLKLMQEQQERSKLYIGVGGIYSSQANFHNTSLGSCGAPSSQAAAIRPETHGSR